MSAYYWYFRAIFQEDYKYIARGFALIRWLGYIPVLFIVYCCYRRKDLMQAYKTTIIYAAFGQLALTLPMACYSFFLSFLTNRDIHSTMLMCTIVHNGVTILEFSGHLTVAIGRFLGVVVGIRLNVYLLTLILVVLTIPHYFALYVTITDGVPIPNPGCSPLLFFSSFTLRAPYTFYMYFPPVIAVFFNLGTLGYVFWHKSKRGPEVRPDRARDELFVALGLLVQSAVPAITIGSRGYVLWVRIFLIPVSPIVSTVTEYTALSTVGLNTLASIVFIRAFRVEFMRLLGRTFKKKKEFATVTITSRDSSELPLVHSHVFRINERDHRRNLRFLALVRKGEGRLRQSQVPYIALFGFLAICKYSGICAPSFLKTIKVRRSEIKDQIRFLSYTARLIALCRWIGFIPSFFVFYCCIRKKELLRLYRTSIIFAAYGQFIMSQPIALYFIFLSFFTGRDIISTTLACTLAHNGATVTEFSAHLVIPVAPVFLAILKTVFTVAIGRFVGVVLGLRLGVFALIALLIVITSPHIAAIYITVFDGVPVPYLDCSPTLFFADQELRQPYNYYMYFPPLIAVAFNLGTLTYVFWHKSRRGTSQSTARSKDELVVTLGLLAQSIVPAITISSRAYFMWIDFFLIEVPVILETGVEYLSYFTVGLNTLASIAFIRPFRQEFTRLIGRPFGRGAQSETSVITVQFRSL